MPWIARAALMITLVGMVATTSLGLALVGSAADHSPVLTAAIERHRG